MSKKITNKIIDQKLIGRQIKRIDNYVSAKTKILFQCLNSKCEYVWKTTPSNIERHGCPKCATQNRAAQRRLNNEIIDKRLFLRPIKRLDNYLDCKTKIRFQCLVQNCNFIWLAQPSNINSGTACPECGKQSTGDKLRANIEKVDKILLSKNIRRIGEYTTARKPIKLQCISCENEWIASIDPILNKETGCPKCAGRPKIDNNMCDERLKNKNIQRIDNYINNRSKITFKCLIDTCNHIWKASPGSIFGGCGCPKCGDKRSAQSKEYSLEEFINCSNIIHNNKYDYSKFEYSGCYVASTIICPDHGKFLQKPAGHIQGHGCPGCGIPGKNEKLIYEWLIQNGIKFEHEYCINKIDNNEKRRFRIDFYFPELNLIIEYNGKQHYSPYKFSSSMSDDEAKARLDKQQLRDEYITEFCLKHNIKLIWIDGREYTGLKLENYLNNNLLKLLMDNK